MGQDIIKIKKAGLLTTIQDLGRKGYQEYGMVVAGAMDSFSLQVANLLVGNARGEAGLEITLLGSEIKFLNDTCISICGADLSPTIDGVNVSNWRSFKVTKGQTLRFGAPRSGVRAYLAIAGGIDVPVIMGSKSTYLKAELGGLNGRALQGGDILQNGDLNRPLKEFTGKGLLAKDIPSYSSSYKAKVILGPEQSAFTDQGLKTFLEEEYKITPQSDRMGYRLAGPSIQHQQSADILSDAIVPGTIQVPKDGKPIILLADRQTVGGYTRIGIIISVDLPFIAQLKPGDTISFEAVSVEEARNLYLQQEKLLRGLALATGDF